MDDVRHQTLFEEGPRGHAAPGFMVQCPLLHAREQPTLIGRSQDMKGGGESGLGLLVHDSQAAPPGLSLARHLGGAVAVLHVLQQLGVNQGGNRYRWPVRRLRDDLGGDGL
jgi:hypothetical protein